MIVQNITQRLQPSLNKNNDKAGGFDDCHQSSAPMCCTLIQTLVTVGKDGVQLPFPVSSSTL
jgi:hypothetical protein